MAREISYNNFEISLVIFMPNITTNHAITYTNFEISLMVFMPIITTNHAITYRYILLWQKSFLAKMQENY